jgi:hypothetical protein
MKRSPELDQALCAGECIIFSQTGDREKDGILEEF